MNDVEKLLLSRLDRIATALEKQRPILPILLFVPSTLRSDQMHELNKMLNAEFRRLGIIDPEATDG